jgi:2-keto-4-pentenoate hydratase/2-oxohepta-3-ene-1,7-dioic acid hydratase in catechol pathway
MRLVTFVLPTPLGPVPRAGACLSDGSVLDLNLAFAALLRAQRHARAQVVADAVVPPDLLSVIRGGAHTLAAAREGLAFAADQAAVDADGRVLRHLPGSVRLLAPLPRPNSIRDFLAVEQHLRNARKAPPPEEWYNLPVYYKGNADAVLGPGDVVVWPGYTEKLDFELELCAVVGVGGRHIAVEDAAEHIYGYTIFNDWSARDIQRREQSVNLGPALGKDFANAFGPCIATSDEFDPLTAVMRARVDGEQWSEGTIAGMHFSFAEMVSWLSEEQELQPGDLLGSGTVAGGCGLELDRWVHPGAVVELEVDGIGILRNVVGQRPEGPLLRGPRGRSQR